MARLEGLDLDYGYRLSNSGNYGGKRSLKSIKYIVIHYTANNGDTAEGNGSYFARTAVGAGAHYFVDEDSCLQSIPDSSIAYHCETPGMKLKGDCRNKNSIGIEMCSKIVNNKYVIPEKTKLNTVTLTKWLMKKYNISESNVIRHYDVSGKRCPEPWLRNEGEWLDFKNKLSENEIKEDDEMVTESYININGKTIKINRILKDGKNYIDIRGLENAGFEVGYNPDTKLPLISNSIKEIDVEDKMVRSVNIDGYNYVSLRDISDVFGKKAEFENGKIVIKD